MTPSEGPPDPRRKAAPAWDELFARRTLGVRLGLTIVQGVYEALGRPGHGRRAVHLVGTNGKGSTAAMIEHALRRRGWHTGLYTSPHLHRVGERVRVDGEAVPDERLHDAVRLVLAAEAAAGQGLERSLSFFELLTLAALVVLEAANVDVMVVEAGLGGRLDATRLVEPRVVAVTSIDMDHQALLGDTLAAITAEKVAVLRPGVPTVSAPQQPEAAAVLRARAVEVGSPLEEVQPRPREPQGLPGAHQRINAAVALAAARHLDAAVTPEDLDGVRWPGRLEVHPWGGGTVVLDAAHNPAGVGTVVEAIEAGRVPRPGFVVFGCQPDKDRDAMVATLDRLRIPRWWVSPDPAVPVPEGGGWARTFASPAPVVAEVLTNELARGAVLLVCGSHPLVAAVRQWALELDGTPDPQDPRAEASMPRR